MKGLITKILVGIIATVSIVSFATGNNFFFTIKSKLPRVSQNQSILEIKSQNNALKAEIASLKNGGVKIIEEKSNTKIPFTIFTSYPFNDKSRLTISLKEGQAEVGDLVSLERNLIGQVSKVNDQYASIKTVFDHSWEFPVYIGPQLSRGLFKAGVEPKVVLISKKEKINPGDLIISADPENLSSRLIVGQVGSITGAESDPFWEVDVDLPYNINELRQVYLLKDEI